VAGKVQSVDFQSLRIYLPPTWYLVGTYLGATRPLTQKIWGLRHREKSVTSEGMPLVFSDIEGIAAEIHE